MKKRFLITGNKGYIATYLERHLLDHYESPIIDGFDLDTEEGAIGNEEYDSIFHLAATSNVDDCNSQVYSSLENNIQTTMDLIHVIGTNQIGSRGIVFASSGAVYKPSTLPHEENDPFIEMNSSLNTYAVSKVICENLLVRARNEYGIKYITLRLANVAGCNRYEFNEHIDKDRTHLFPNLARAYTYNTPFYVHGDSEQIRDYVHVDDVCRAMIMSYEAMKSNASIYGAINISSAEGYKVKDLIDMMGQYTSIRPKIEYKQARSGDRPILVLDNSFAKQLLDWSPKKTIHDIVKDYSPKKG